jgi:aryl-phospho-beta-D-glucosidase BglC (GH1 family)
MKCHAEMTSIAFASVLLWAGASLTVSTAAPSFLHVGGTETVNANGGVVRLNGVNFGGWMVMEKWMCPLDSGSLPDAYSVIQELDNRFGVATEQSLIRAYQTNWISTTDLDNIRNGGYNCVRVPVWWGNFYSITNVSYSGWRSDAFDELDWLVTNCAARGIYVIIDMHGVVGGQSTSEDTGQENQNQYWSNVNDQTNTAWMWWQIANHYNGNSTVAGYDLINEPDGAPNTAAVWSAYNSLYGTIRSVDTNHIIIMQGTFGSWNWNMLPNPAVFGWTNIVYSMHEYQLNGNVAQVEAGADNQVTDFKNHSTWNVPDYIGEFNDFSNGLACWNYSASAYNNAGINWTVWTYKAADGLLPDAWGWYDPTYWPATPNISSDSASAIASDWHHWLTSAAFGQNTSIAFPPNTNPPLIIGEYPDGTAFFQCTNTLSFTASSVNGIATNGIAVTLDGVDVSGALVLSGSSASWSVSYPNLPANATHTAVITVTDIFGNSSSETITFDTFQPGCYTWEAEDYDYGGGQYFDNPQVDSYSNYYATAGVDFNDVNTGGAYLYRPSGTATEITADLPRVQFAGKHDYDIGFFSLGEWGNYTRHYPAGAYNVWGRFAAGGGNTACFLDQVTAGVGTSNQSTNVVGVFNIANSSWSSFVWVPLEDTNGNLVKMTFNGSANTLRLARPDPSTGFPDVNVNFLMLVPAASASPIALAASTSGGKIILSFPTQAGFTYQAEYKNNLTDGSWVPLGNAISGNGSIQSINDTMGQGSRFYHVRIQ